MPDENQEYDRIPEEQRTDPYPEPAGSGHCVFEPEIKLTCITEIISLFRSGELSGVNAANILMHASCFIGSAASLYKESQMNDNDDNGGWIFGSSAKHPADFSAESTKQLVNRLEQGTATLNQAQAATPAAAGIPWSIIFKIVVPVLLELLKRLDTDQPT